MGKNSKGASIPRQQAHLQTQRDAIRRSQLEIRKIGRQLRAMEIVGAVMSTVSALVFVQELPEVVFGVIMVSVMMLMMAEDLSNEAVARENRRIYGRRLERGRAYQNLCNKRARIAWDAAAPERAAAAKREKLRQKACGTKIRHETERAAAGHMRRLERKDRAKMNVYRCEFCEFWHVGHDIYAQENWNGLTHRPFEHLMQEKSA